MLLIVHPADHIPLVVLPDGFRRLGRLTVHEGQ
jgi:hypothetical protein